MFHVSSIRRWITLCEKASLDEAYSAGGYSAHVWQRWWGNDRTGEVLPVGLSEDHDSYFFAHLDQFLTSVVRDQLPDPDDLTTYEDADPDDPIQNNRDAILVAAYDRGWIAILYDGNQKELSMRTTDQPPALHGIQKILRKITADVPVLRMQLEMNQTNTTLDADEIEHFIKTGRLPPVRS